MQISLKGLLITVAFCGAFFWCARQPGFEKSAFWIVVFVSLVTSVLFVVLARSRRRYLPLLATIPALLIGFLGLALSLMTFALLLTVAVLILAQRPPLRTKSLCYIAAILFLVVFAISVLPGVADIVRLERLQREIPVVSLEKRLQYENQTTRPRVAAVALSAPVATDLSKFEECEKGSMRTYLLECLHQRAYTVFIHLPGFGVERLGEIDPNELLADLLKDIPFSAGADTQMAPKRWGGWNGIFTWDETTGIERIHHASRDDFLDPAGFGYVIEPVRRVLGFEPHALHYPPTASLKEPKSWTIVKLELVSLLKFNEPRVYVLDHLPRMDQLTGDKVPTRQLDEFETTALGELRAEKDVVVDHQGSEYRMLGSLRAAMQCMNCHSVDRGELLGAFSYALHSNLMAEAN